MKNDVIEVVVPKNYDIDDDCCTVTVSKERIKDIGSIVVKQNITYDGKFHRSFIQFCDGISTSSYWTSPERLRELSEKLSHMADDLEEYRTRTIKLIPEE
jgi:hypothetical protein